MKWSPQTDALSSMFWHIHTYIWIYNDYICVCLYIDNIWICVNGMEYVNMYMLVVSLGYPIEAFIYKYL